MTKRPVVDVFDRRVVDTLPDGWLTAAEAEALADLARDKAVLEVGSWLGRSTIAMARTAKCVVAVDHHRGSNEHRSGEAGQLRDPKTGELSTLRRFLANLEAAGVSDRVVPIVAPFSQAWPYLMPIFDLVFIDAQHDHDSVMQDGQSAADCLTGGGKLVFHDYGTWSGVVSAVERLQRRWKAKLEGIPNTSLAVLTIA